MRNSIALFSHEENEENAQISSKVPRSLKAGHFPLERTSGSHETAGSSGAHPQVEEESENGHFTHPHEMAVRGASSRVTPSLAKRGLFRELAFARTKDVPQELSLASSQLRIAGDARKEEAPQGNLNRRRTAGQLGLIGMVGGRVVDRQYPILAPCKIGCRYGCNNYISPAARIQINQKFWNADFSHKRLFLLRFAKDGHCASNGTNLPEEARRRHRSTRFFLMNIEGKKCRVCKTMFLHTLGLSSDARLKSFRRSQQFNIDEICKDHRGGCRRYEADIHASISKHIDSYNPQVSHYNREHAPLRRYLEATLSIMQMHAHFLSDFHYQRFCYETFRQEFLKKRISFGPPEPDLCDLCERAKLHLKGRHLPNEPACLECGKYALHQKFAAIARAKYEHDASTPVDLDTGIFSIDMQRVLLIPIMKGKNYFFTSRLVCFNETFGCLQNGQDTCMLWHEAITGRNAHDVASSFHAFIRANCPPLKHLIIWADNCGPQNKNWVLYSSFLELVSSTTGPHSITMRYLEKGHTFMRSDSIHGLIGKRLKQTAEVLTFQDLIELIQDSKKDVLVAPLAAGDFTNFPNLKTGNRALPKLRGLKEVRVQKGSPYLMYKRDLNALDYFQRRFAFDEIPPIPISKNVARGINIAKKATICSQLVPQMVEEKRDFWVTLPTGDGADLCSEHS